MFKKRCSKGNIRKREENTSENEGDDETNLDMLQYLKAEQDLRKKLKGQSLVELVDENPKATKQTKQTARHSIEDMMGSQFALRTDDAHNFHSHEKIMEQYINEKLGLVEDTKEMKKQNTAEDEIYKLPDTIRVVPKVSEGEGDRDNSDVDLLGVGTGIAEVALPISFKLSNIEATEMARKKLEDSRRGRGRRTDFYGSVPNSRHGEQIKQDPSTFRYQKPSQRPPTMPGQNRDQHNHQHSNAPAFSSGPAIPAVPTVEALNTSGGGGFGDGAGMGGGAPGGHGHHHGERSRGYAMRNDDMIMERFKKNQQNRRR